MATRALITGITGQDGSYLAEMLLDKGYEVHGVVRRRSTIPTERIDHIIDELYLHYGDVTDAGRMFHLIWDIEPDEIYNLAAQSHVRISFEATAETVRSIVDGSTNILDAAKELVPDARIYQSCSSEMYGISPPPQDEGTLLQPASPYACAKTYMHHLGKHYRRAYKLFVANGILFNHESPRRGVNFVTRKIARGAARIAAGLQSELLLGNPTAARDWGYAPEYCEAMWMMLQHTEPDDFVIATGEEHTVQECVEVMFNHLGLDRREYVRTSDRYKRPEDVMRLCGDSSKARKVLGWEPYVSFYDLCRIMVEAEVDEIEGDAHDPRHRRKRHGRKCPPRAPEG